MNRRVLLLASYCGDDTPGCTESTPCSDCLNMCNIVDATVIIRQNWGGIDYRREHGFEVEVPDPWARDEEAHKRITMEIRSFMCSLGPGLDQGKADSEADRILSILGLPE